MTFLETTIEVPVWYPVMAVLVGAIVGLAIMLLATWFGSRGGRSKVDTGSKVTDVVKVGKHGFTVKQPAPIQILLSSEQRANLESRAKIDGGYHVADLVRMLGMPEREIMRWIRSKKLSLYTDNYRQTWVTAVSVLSLVNELSPKQEPVATRSAPIKQEDKKSSVRKPPLRQFYWYRTDGKSEPKHATLAEALKEIGYEVKEGKPVDWMRLPVAVRDKIQREKL